jgi:hypothetical protein
MNLLNPKFPKRPFTKSTRGKDIKDNISFAKLSEEKGSEF